MISNITTNPANNSKENIPTTDVIMKNQNENPAVTANDLNLGEDSSILNRVNECYQTTLSKCCYTDQSDEKCYYWKHVEFSFFHIQFENLFNNS